MTEQAIAPAYPEHEKLAAAKDQSQAIGEFLDWLPVEGYHVGRWVCAGHYDPCTNMFGRPQRQRDLKEGEHRDIDYYFHDEQHLADCNAQVLRYAEKGISALLAEYFEIDEQRLADEKDQILRDIRSAGEQR